jgi:hypothetical protein
VRKFKLDELVAGEQVGFIKIDVEGHEMDVIKGARQLIGEYRPRVLVEAEDQHQEGTVQEVFKYFANLDYLGVFYFKGEMYQVDTFSQKYHQKKTSIRLGPRGEDYVNNFIFIPSEDKAILRDLLGRNSKYK